MTEHRTLLTCGEHAVLVEVGGLDQVVSFGHAVREAVAAGLPGFTDIVDVVPAARTVLVVVTEKSSVTTLRQALASLPFAGAEEARKQRPGDRRFRCATTDLISTMLPS